MTFKIIRNDITKMDTEAIVNTANKHVRVGPGCDSAIYKAAGYDQLIAYRKQNIGDVEEGKSFLTPGFDLKSQFIIHTVSPLYKDGCHGEEEKLRSCYRSSLAIAKDNNIHSIAFPLISTGGFGYPKEEGMRIAVDEIHAFLLSYEMEIILVVFDQDSTNLGKHLFPKLESFIDQNYLSLKESEECEDFLGSQLIKQNRDTSLLESLKQENSVCQREDEIDFDLEHEYRLDERIGHISDTFSEFLMFLIQSKGLENADVYKRAIINKKVFSKIKNNSDYHPQKITALCLCIGTMLNIDEAKDLLARAGYALSPCDKTDIIFSYFIENKIYDMIELDIQLEEHGLPCIIT